MSIDWTEQLTEQLDWHWRQQLRPRLDGLTDDEYFWEPVAGCWSVRPRGDEVAIDWEYPQPTPPPVTTIAWRLAHIIVGIFGARTASHFGGPPCDYESFRYAGTAGEALRQLDEAYAAWAKGVRGLDAEALARPCGPAEGPYAALPMAGLVLHINRETIHHGAEIALLRDLYRDRALG
jgi:DinB superfamily